MHTLESLAARVSALEKALGLDPDGATVSTQVKPRPPLDPGLSLKVMAEANELIKAAGFTDVEISPSGSLVPVGYLARNPKKSTPEESKAPLPSSCFCAPSLKPIVNAVGFWHPELHAQTPTRPSPPMSTVIGGA